MHQNRRSRQTGGGGGPRGRRRAGRARRCLAFPLGAELRGDWAAGRPVDSSTARASFAPAPPHLVSPSLPRGNPGTCWKVDVSPPHTHPSRKESCPHLAPPAAGLACAGSSVYLETSFTTGWRNEPGVAPAAHPGVHFAHPSPSPPVRGICVPNLQGLYLVLKFCSFICIKTIAPLGPLS